VRFQFSNFIVDDETRQLLRDGVDVHLSPKALDLLVLLVGERPRALTKADLHKRIWPKTFVSDASLAMLIAEIRSALGETAREPRFLRTVHRHGYAFQESARELSATADASTSYWLVLESSQVALLPGDNIVGRDPQARVWIDAPSVSRRHARLHVNGNGVTLEDLGSKNGTHAGDARVTSATRLHNGDAMRFGSVGATLRAWSPDPTKSVAS